MTIYHDLLPDALRDVRNAWSMGSFGAIAEFTRNADESVKAGPRGRLEQQVTARGGIGVDAAALVIPIAYDLLSSDGQTWNHAVAFCLTYGKPKSSGTLRCLGTDQEALQPRHSLDLLFDLGVTNGETEFCIRTHDPVLVDELHALEGTSLLDPAAANVRTRMAQISPHRVTRSPIGRIEVYAPIPPNDGRSPDGPHTHLLPKLLRSRRSHGANVPIPNGLEPALTLHPRSPWRDGTGGRTPFDAGLNEEFEDLFARYGLPEDQHIRATTEAAVLGGANPATYDWPTTRRGRAQARITLRRLAQRLGTDRVRHWRELYDHGPVAEEEAMHA